MAQHTVDFIYRGHNRSLRQANREVLQDMQRVGRTSSSEAAEFARAEQTKATAAQRTAGQVKAYETAQTRATRATAAHTRTAGLATRANTGLRNSFSSLGLSLPIIGLAGVAVALKGTIVAATDAERVQRKLEVAMRNAGLSYAEHRRHIETVINSHAKLSGLDDEELSESFSNMIRTTKNVNEALRLNAIVADIARTKGQDLAGAQSLVARVYNGSYMGLKRLGVAFSPVTAAQDALRASSEKATVAQTRAAKEADKIASRQAAIAAMQRAFAGQADAYGKTSAGAQDRFRVATENLQEAIGGKLMPTFTNGIRSLTGWVERMVESGEASRKTEEAIRLVRDVIRGITPPIQAAVAVTRTFVRVLGGAENAAKLLMAVFVARKMLALGEGLVLLSGRVRGVGRAANTARGTKGAGVVGLMATLSMLGGMKIAVPVIITMMVSDKIPEKWKRILFAPGREIADLLGLGGTTPGPTGVPGFGVKDIPRGAPKPTGIVDPFSAVGALTGAPGQGIAKTARSQKGVPYSWGGGGTAGPGYGTGKGAKIFGFDCSSFVQYTMSQNGISVPRTTSDQWKAGRAVTGSNLQVGDLVFFHAGPQGPEHVGIYLGNDTFIHAPHTGDVVKEQKFSGYPGYMGARRFIADAGAGGKNAPKPSDKGMPDKPAEKRKGPRGQGLRDLAYQIAEQAGIPPELFMALVSKETGGTWDPKSKSPKGAMGLTQLMPGTARGLGVKDPWDPKQNLTGGAKYLMQMYRKFGSWPLALAAYNAGPGAVSKYKGIPPYKETQDYVSSILADMQGLGGKDLRATATPKKPRFPSELFTARQRERFSVAERAAAETPGMKDDLSILLEQRRLLERLKRRTGGKTAMGKERRTQIIDELAKLDDAIKDARASIHDANVEETKRLRERVAKAVARTPRRDSHDPREERDINVWRRREEKQFQARERRERRTGVAGVRELLRETYEPFEKPKVVPLEQIRSRLRELEGVMQTGTRAARQKAEAEMAKLRQSLPASVQQAQDLISAKQEKFRNAFGRLSGKIMTAFDRQTQRGLQSIRQRVEAEVDAIRRSAENLTPGEGALGAFREGRAAQRRAEQMAEVRQRISTATTPEERMAAERELREMLLDEQEATLEKQATAEREALNRSTEERIKALQEQAAAEEQSFQDSRDGQRQMLEDQLAQWEQWLLSEEKTMEDFLAWINGEETKGLFAESDINPVKRMGGAGRAAGEAYAAGFLDEIGKIAEALAELASSPATWTPPAPSSNPNVPGGRPDGMQQGGIAGLYGGMYGARRRGPRDTIPLWVAPGEAVLSQSELRQVRRRLDTEPAPAVAGGPNVMIVNPTFLTGDRASARALARMVEAELGGIPRMTDV